MFTKKKILLSASILCISFFMLYMAYKSYNAPSGSIGANHYPAHVMVESFEREGLHHYSQMSELYELYKKDATEAKRKMFLFIAASVLCMLSAGYIFLFKKESIISNQKSKNCDKVSWKIESLGRFRKIKAKFTRFVLLLKEALSSIRLIPYCQTVSFKFDL